MLDVKSISKKKELRKLAEYYQDCLDKIATLYVERRSDISEICQSVLRNDHTFDPERPLYMTESRFIQFKYQGACFQYDTLTTCMDTNGKPEQDEISDIIDEEWKTLKTEYED